MYASEIANFLFCEVRSLVGSRLQTMNSAEEINLFLVQSFGSSLEIRRSCRRQLVDFLEVGYFRGLKYRWVFDFSSLFFRKLMQLPEINGLGWR